MVFAFLSELHHHQCVMCFFTHQDCGLNDEIQGERTTEADTVEGREGGDPNGEVDKADGREGGESSVEAEKAEEREGREDDVDADKPEEREGVPRVTVEMAEGRKELESWMMLCGPPSAVMVL